MVLGSWLSLPTAPSLTAGYDMGAFADAVGYVHPRSEIDATNAEYEYKGLAAGLYARGSYSPTGSLRGDATVGSFTATTELTATFTATTTFGGAEGKVTNFEENGESLGDWEVRLRNTGNTATVVLFPGATTGVAERRNLTGQWGVQFIGSDHATLGGFGYAVGTFSATTGAAANNQRALHIVGAFGAERQP